MDTFGQQAATGAMAGETKTWFGHIRGLRVAAQLVTQLGAFWSGFSPLLHAGREVLRSLT